MPQTRKNHPPSLLLLHPARRECREPAPDAAHRPVVPGAAVLRQPQNGRRARRESQARAAADAPDGHRSALRQAAPEPAGTGPHHLSVSAARRRDRSAEPVFKTPHLKTTNHRDDHYTLVDICIASTAAPLYRSLASIPTPGNTVGPLVFADGGLWANNSVLVGLTEALEMTSSGQAIEIFCLGTCPRPAGEDTGTITLDRGLAEWKFGGEAAKLAIDAQEYAYDNIARMISRHVDRPCEIVRFPREQVPAALMPYLDLDETCATANDALVRQAHSDANLTNSRCADPQDRAGQLVNNLFMQMPEWKESTIAAPVKRAGASTE